MLLGSTTYCRPIIIVIVERVTCCPVLAPAKEEGRKVVCQGLARSGPPIISQNQGQSWSRTYKDMFDPVFWKECSNLWFVIIEEVRGSRKRLENKV